MVADHVRHFDRADIPMGEFWLRSPTHDKPNDIADAVSGARIYGKNIVQAEAYTQLGIRWDEHPGMLKPLADEHFAKGINRLVFHVFAHNPWTDRRPGMTLDRVGLYFQRDQTWWPEVKAWTDYVARCSALLQAGRPVVDVAYFSGEDLPSRAVLKERRSMELPAGYQADSTNADALTRLAAVKQGQLVLPGGASYAALVLPDRTSPSADIMRLGADLARSGGVFAWPGGHPLGEQLAKAGIPPDLAWTADKEVASDAIAWAHRRTADAEIYFVANQTGKSLKLSVKLRSLLVPELWDPVTGVITHEVPHGRLPGAQGFAAVNLELAPFASKFIVMRKRSGGMVAEALTKLPPLSPPEIAGPWDVRFSPEFGGPEKPVGFERLVDWTAREEFGIRHYSGTAVYRTAFENVLAGNPSTVWLDLGEVNNLARVFVNGVDCGVAWTAPYRVDIGQALRPGRNELEIRVTNTWANRILGDATSPESERITWTTAPASTRPEKLLPAGLLGPVTITIEETK